jgi:hypothetical protein
MVINLFKGVRRIVGVSQNLLAGEAIGLYIHIDGHFVIDFLLPATRLGR